MANKRITDVDHIGSLDSGESFFVNHNNTIKQINKSDVVFGITNGGTGATTVAGARKALGLGDTEGALPIASGGTGANNVADARTNLDVYSKSEIHSLMYSGTITILSDVWELNDTYGGLYYAGMSGAVPYVNSESTIFVTPAQNLENFNAYIENKVRAYEQGLETINFLAETKPDIDIIVNYVVFA